MSVVYFVNVRVKPYRTVVPDHTALRTSPLHTDITPLSLPLLQSFTKKAVDHVQTHLAKKQVPPTLFQVSADAM